MNYRQNDNIKTPATFITNYLPIYEWCIFEKEKK